jgi:gluconolactonase
MIEINSMNLLPKSSVAMSCVAMSSVAIGKIFLVILFLVILLCGTATNNSLGNEPAKTSANPSLVAADASLQLVVGDCKFSEGPAADKDGNVYFTDQPNDRIVRVDIDGAISDFLKPAGRSNGMFFAPDGKLIACADENNEMWEIDSNGKHRVLFDSFADKKLNGPNDVWVHPSLPVMYFTDPYYQRPWWKHKTKPQDTQAIYRVDRDGKNVERLNFEFVQPNGIVGDTSRSLLYVADIGEKKTYVFKIGPDGSLSDRKLFCEEGSDGMTIDELGNVYLTGKSGVGIFAPDGTKLETIAIPEKWTANVCFGGADRKTLFVTASDSLYTVKMNVAGMR